MSDWGISRLVTLCAVVGYFLWRWMMAKKKSGGMGGGGKKKGSKSGSGY